MARRFICSITLLLALFLTSNAIAHNDHCAELLAVQTFQAPPSFKSRWVKPEDIRWVKTNTGEESDSHEFDDYLKKIIKLRKTIAKKLPRSNDVKWVLYPASGSDAGYPTLLFEEANVIAIDNHPIISKKIATGKDPIKLKTPLSRYRDSRHQWTGDLDTNGTLLPEILTRLSLSVENFRLLGIELLTRQGDGSVHGIIHFDAGPGTQARKYIQIKAVPGMSIAELGESAPWWHKVLAEIHLDAVVVKASQEAVGTGGFRRDILNWLLKTQGVLIEGLDLGLGNYSGELTGYGPKHRHMFRSPDLTIPLEFGYRDRIYVFQFTEPFTDHELQSWD